MTHHTCPAHAIGMADGDGTTVYVQARFINAQLVAAVKNLAGERFVQLPKADITHAQSVPLE
ncbi:hypothetical protein D3C81_2011090 [compost metagenome]